MRSTALNSERPDNPLLAPWDGPEEAPPFDRFRAADVLPALDHAIAEAEAELDAIAADPRPATFAAVMVPLERSGAALARVRRLFWTVAGAQSTAEIRALEPEVSARLTHHCTRMLQDARLFRRVAAVWDGDEALGGDQRRLVEQTVRGFERGGARLDEAGKARLAAIDERVSALSVRFGQAVLAANAAWTLDLGEDETAGLPVSALQAAADRAAAAGLPGRFRFTLDRGDFEDVLTFAERREVRERMWRAFTARGDGGEHDTNPVLAEIVALRHERAALLGYPSYAHLALADSMARTPQAARGLMERVWARAMPSARAEMAALQARIAEEGGNFALEPWDWRFYAEQVRRERYSLDGAAVKEHLPLARVRDAAFASAGRLYGLRFDPRDDLPGWHPDVRAFRVTENGRAIGLLYTDWFARAEKHGGAWMGSLRVQEALDGPVTPIVYVVTNFARAADPDATRLSLDEARTLFHEFGHALHGLLSRVTYPSQSGTSVPRDFVELPSKFMENWVAAPAILGGFGMPADLVAAIGEADAFGQGFATIEFLASALADMAIHDARGIGREPATVAEEALTALGKPPEIPMRHRLPHFTHLFDGGYAAAYYSYLWSEVLDADAFAAFGEAGDVFDPALARAFREEVLAVGDTRDPAESYRAFRGREPDEAALVRARRLEAVG